VIDEIDVMGRRISRDRERERERERNDGRLLRYRVARPAALGRSSTLPLPSHGTISRNNPRSQIDSVRFCRIDTSMMRQRHDMPRQLALEMEKDQLPVAAYFPLH